MAGFDLVVVGGGTAGLIGAQTAARLGARVALVEAARTGGECLYTGCMPSKALIAAARDGLGFDVAMARARAAIAAIEPHDSPEALEEAGVRVLHGLAVLDPDGTVCLEGRRLPSLTVLLATGAAPALPSLEGLGPCGALTSETLWSLAGLPERLAVVGGGPVGCELAQAFARLGSEVTVVASAPRLLPGEDPDASALVRDALEADGVRVLAGDRAVAVSQDGAGWALRTAGGTKVPYTHLLAATGKAPRTHGIGLVEAGIRLDGRGHAVTDETLRTTNPRVWAAGDVTARSRHTHTAGVHAAAAAANAVLGTRRKAGSIPEPRVAFTAPEVAAVGQPTAAGAPRTLTVPHTRVDRAVADADPRGFTRIALDRSGRILGGTIVGPRAGETLGELSLAVHAGLKAQHVAGAVHAYPTHSDGLWSAAIQARLAGLDAPPARAAARLLLALRRAIARTR
ncbi:dihydrolipoyl dehydrogenase family protein [Sinomonas sp. G460-2]|uniref:dihydrolipoyl dehydrogenase family protein n=1 Tax=Sinomonas sp. G460-2 TaxID=3393464 RepID=UPI0039EEEA45